MAGSLNEAKLIGNLTRDPEVRQTNGGQTVCSFSMATNRSYTDKQGTKHDEPEYHNIVAWGKLAEICGKYLVKGKKVYVCGRIQTRSYEDKDGVKKYRTEIICEDMIMLSMNSDDRRTGSGRDESDQGGGYDEPSTDEIKPEDIPF
jgi:single-strand DNA-binding protein